MGAQQQLIEDLTPRVRSGENMPTYSAERQVKTEAFFDRYPVFSLEQAGRAFGQQNRRATMERLRYHVSTGRLKAVARGIRARCSCRTSSFGGSRSTGRSRRTACSAGREVVGSPGAGISSCRT